mmetsp:Transcript_79891/g.258939  ORF Transcript_79891/g.258939 Transcript_79891/m.258939 type:complete len:331 (+) Transcript_79891:90-1082(+)
MSKLAKQKPLTKTSSRPSQAASSRDEVNETALKGQGQSCVHLVVALGGLTALVELAVRNCHLAVDDFLPRVHGPREAAGHARQRQRNLDEHLLLGALGAVEVAAAGPADPARSVQEHQPRNDDAAADVLARRDGAGSAVRLAAEAVAVGLLNTLGLSDLQIEALGDDPARGVLLLAGRQLVDGILELFVVLLVVLARLEPGGLRGRRQIPLRARGQLRLRRGRGGRGHDAGGQACSEPLPRGALLLGLRLRLPGRLREGLGPGKGREAQVRRTGRGRRGRGADEADGGRHGGSAGEQRDGGREARLLHHGAEHLPALGGAVGASALGTTT